jgi:hypothetical protein
LSYRIKAGRALIFLAAALKPFESTRTIGNIGGFPISIEKFGDRATILINGKHSYRANVSDSPAGTIASLEHALDSIEDRLRERENQSNTIPPPDCRSNEPARSSCTPLFGHDTSGNCKACDSSIGFSTYGSSGHASGPFPSPDFPIPHDNDGRNHDRRSQPHNEPKVQTLEGVGCTHGDIGHEKGGDGGDGARQHHGQVLRNPLWPFRTTLLQGAEIRDAERRANATKDNHRDPVRIAAAEQEDAKNYHNPSGGGHDTGTAPIQWSRTAAPIRGVAPTRQGKIETQNGDKEQEGIGPDERQRDGREENYHHAPEKDCAAIHVPPMRDVQGLGQSRHGCGGQCCEAREDMNNKEYLR